MDLAAAAAVEGVGVLEEGDDCGGCGPARRVRVVLEHHCVVVARQEKKEWRARPPLLHGWFVVSLADPHHYRHAQQEAEQEEAVNGLQQLDAPVGTPLVTPHSRTIRNQTLPVSWL